MYDSDAIESCLVVWQCNKNGEETSKNDLHLQTESSNNSIWRLSTFTKSNMNKGELWPANLHESADDEHTLEIVYNCEGAIC